MLGYAVLAREGLFLPLILALAALAPIQLWCSRDWRASMLRLWSLAGFLIPLSLFGVYLWSQGLTAYWWQTAFELPKLYVSIFSPDGLISSIRDLLTYLFQFSLGEHSRQTVFALIILASVAVWVLAAIGWRDRRGDPALLFVALTSCLLLSSAVHLREIFRLATSITIGTALVFALCDRLRLAGPLFALTALALVIGAFGNDNGNLFPPSRAQIEATTTSNRIGIFAGQRWSQDIFDYYDWYAGVMHDLQARGCGIRYFKNETRDAFLEALTPFTQYQLMPFGAGFFDVPLDEWTRKLRPDYNYSERWKARDMLVVTVRKPDADEARRVPDGHRILNPAIPAQDAPARREPHAGYTLFSSRLTPRSWYFRDGLVTLIFVPDACVMAKT